MVRLIKTVFKKSIFERTIHTTNYTDYYDGYWLDFKYDKTRDCFIVFNIPYINFFLILII